MKTQSELIEYYQKNLNTVKKMHSTNNKSSLLNEKSQEYIDFAEDSLNAVINGRNW